MPTSKQRKRQRNLGAVSGSAIATRFDLERRALASMSHRCIAKVFDVGSTPEGQPYFAMELVEGTPLTQFCNDNNLSLQDRLELFQQVCEGVQHAHNKGVVHRDLKPANILVAREGEHAIPKILDFGLVKITGGDLHESAPLSAPDARAVKGVPDVGRTRSGNAAPASPLKPLKPDAAACRASFEGRSI